MSNNDVPPGPQQAGNITNNTTNCYTEKVTDSGSSYQGTIGANTRTTDAAMQMKVSPTGKGTGGQHLDHQDACGSPSSQQSGNPSRNPPRACEKCQQTNGTDSTCACTSSHKSADPETHKPFFRPPECRENVRTGHIYRIWQPEGAVMHLSTVLIMIDRGRSWSACKFVQGKSLNSDFNFKEYCAPIHVHTGDHPCTEVNHHIRQANCHSVTVYPKASQKLHENCWIDLERSYDIGNEGNYEFVFCGHMDKESFKYAKKKHLDLYSH